jgi:hypothetical protein
MYTCWCVCVCVCVVWCVCVVCVCVCVWCVYVCGVCVCVVQKRYIVSHLIFVRSCLLSLIVIATAANQLMSLQYTYPQMFLILFQCPPCSSIGFPIKIEYTFLVWSIFGVFHISSLNVPTITTKPIACIFENPLRTLPPFSFYFTSR